MWVVFLRTALEIPGRNCQHTFPRDVRQTIFGGYLQDDWRWLPNLTLNLGLRYEMATIPTEIHGKLANLRNLKDANPHLGDPFFVNNPQRRISSRG